MIPKRNLRRSPWGQGLETHESKLHCDSARGLVFRVWGLGFRIWGLGFGFFGFRVWGLGFRVWGLGFGVLGASLA